MKYCASCNEKFDSHIQRCVFCGLPLIEIPDKPSADPAASQDQQVDMAQPGSAQHTETLERTEKTAQQQLPQEGNANSAQDAQSSTERPRQHKTTGETLFASVMSVIGSTVGILLLILVAGVLVFSIFRSDIFGNTAGSNDKDTPQTSSEPSDNVAASTPAAETDTPAITLATLVISETDKSAYDLLCGGAVWVDESSQTALSFYNDNTYLYSDLDGKTIMNGEAAVSDGLLYMSSADGEFRTYTFYFEDDVLYITDDETGVSTAYVSSEPGGGNEEKLSLFEYNVTSADYTSYMELVESGPWTDLDTGFTLSFYTDNTYIAESESESGRFGSALVSNGMLCMVLGSDYETVYECTYTLSAGTLTISYENESWSLLSYNAYQALLLGEQYDIALFEQLVDGSYWCTRGDQYLYYLYFFEDHTFELYSVDLYSGVETPVRGGEATVTEGVLTLTFYGTAHSYTITIEDNLLYMTDASTGSGTTTYETYKTFNY